MPRSKEKFIGLNKNGSRKKSLDDIKNFLIDESSQKDTIIVKGIYGIGKSCLIKEAIRACNKNWYSFIWNKKIEGIVYDEEGNIKNYKELQKAYFPKKESFQSNNDQSYELPTILKKIKEHDSKFFSQKIWRIVCWNHSLDHPRNYDINSIHREIEIHLRGEIPYRIIQEVRNKTPQGLKLYSTNNYEHRSIKIKCGFSEDEAKKYISQELIIYKKYKNIQINIINSFKKFVGQHPGLLSFLCCFLNGYLLETLKKKCEENELDAYIDEYIDTDRFWKDEVKKLIHSDEALITYIKEKKNDMILREYGLMIDKNRPIKLLQKYINSIENNGDNNMKKQIFICYAREDEKIKNELVTHLKALRYKGINAWNDENIKYGTKWEPEIQKNIKDAQVFVCLISKNFFASDFIREKESKWILKREEQGMTIINVIVGYCAWENVLWTKERQNFPRNLDKNKPINSIKDEDERDKKLIEITNAIDEYFENDHFRHENKNTQTEKPSSKKPTPESITPLKITWPKDGDKIESQEIPVSGSGMKKGDFIILFLEFNGKVKLVDGIARLTRGENWEFHIDEFGLIRKYKIQAFKIDSDELKNIKNIFEENVISTFQVLTQRLAETNIKIKTSSEVIGVHRSNVPS